MDVEQQLVNRSLFSIPHAEQWELTSKNGSKYCIMTWRPHVETPADGFPVMYTLDANAVFGSMVEMIRLQSRRKDKIDPAVVVGIGYNTDQPFDTNRRFFDYTVYADKDEFPVRKESFQLLTTGGADDFLTFIESELKPIIEKAFPIDKRRQTLFGHSLGGFFVLYTLFKKRSAFQYYAAGSPSIWWKNHYIMKDAERFIESDAQTETGLIIGVGSQEKPHMVEDAQQMYDRLSTAGIEGLTVKYHYFEEEDHVSVIPPFLNRTLRFTLGRR